MLWQNASEATSPRELLSSVQYDKVGNVVSSTDPLGRVTTYKYDTAHRSLGMVDALGNETEAELDAQGNPKRSIRREKTPDGQTIEVIETATFDALGRPIEQRDPLNNTTTLTWDARSRLRRLTDPENAVTTRTYDGLDRLVRQDRPEGIVEKWTFDESSRLLAYADAKDQTTTTSYDALNRPIEITWADNTTRRMAYDAASNVIEERDPNGNVITQAHDAANRLVTRTIAKGVGVVGPTSETYAWDGLNRLKTATSGSMTVDYEYDSLSRVLMEKQNGREIRAQFDDASNRTQLVYPSGLAVGQRFDALDRPSVVFRVGAGGAEEGAATYRYRGVDLLAEQTVGAGTAAKWQYDGARRTVGRTFDSSAGRSSLEERLTWTPRGQIGSITRKDLGGAGWLFAYDQASQLKARGASGDAASLAAPNSTVAPELVAALGQSETFEHDNVQNLTLRRDFGVGTVDEVSSPQDATGRNRPSSVGGKSLAWDSNGNLTAKGDLRFEYDYRNRLARVTRLGQEIAAYDYDAFNRRMKRVVGDRTVTTTWNGWRSIEEQVDGSVDERWIYGLGLDEIVERQKADGAGGFDHTALVYASTGEPVVQITQDGKPIERYVQTALGERKVLVDAERPKPTQVAATPSGIEIGLSEQVREPEPNVGASGLRAGTQGITLTNVATGETFEVVATLASEPGPGLERRRLMLHVEEPPPAGTQVRLQVTPAALEDFFANRAEGASEWSFAWPASGMSVVEDTAQPELLRALLKDGKVELTFSEPVSTTGLAAAVTIDGAPATWTTSADGLVATMTTALPAGAHEVEISTGAIDLAGKGLAEPMSLNLTVPSAERRDLAGVIQLLHEKQNPREVPQSPTGQRASFQGHLIDEETGFVYLRNRYFDPEMGRFITADPLGNVDGPSEYAFGAGDWVNGRDPMGLCSGMAAASPACRQAALRLLGYGVGLLESAIGLALSQPLMAIAEVDRGIDNARRLTRGFRRGGIKGALNEAEWIEGEQQQRSRDQLLGLIPGVNTYRLSRDLESLCLNSNSSFKCGRQVGKTTFSFGADATLGYGGGRALQAKYWPKRATSPVNLIAQDPPTLLKSPESAGNANLHYYSPESLNQKTPHFSVETLGEGGLHTHQVILRDRSTTMTLVGDGLPSPTKTFSIRLADSQAAKAQQVEMLGAKLGMYCYRNNSCLTSAADILRAGGAEIPVSNVQLRIWIKGLSEER